MLRGVRKLRQPETYWKEDFSLLIFQQISHNSFENFCFPLLKGDLILISSLGAWQ